MQYKIFGCKVNKYYTDKWLDSDYLRNKTGIFVASCVVTDKAKKKWMKFVKDNIDKIGETEKMYISGCGAFEKGKEHNNFFQIYTDLQEYAHKIEILPESPQGFEKNGDFSFAGNKIESLHKKMGTNLGLTKKFVLIQGGCDSYCSFCLTVKKRGKHYFRSKEDILEEILDFHRADGKEIVLTGVNLSAWGLASTNDIGKSRFAELLQYILDNTDIPRIRISSLGPEFIDDKVLEFFTKKRIYPHFHYSVQSASTNILKAMRRHYNGTYIKNLLHETKNIIREDGVEVSIGADIIVGFPGESDEDFQETYELVAGGSITKLHVFPFSAHKFGESVPAGFFSQQVDEATKQKRLSLLFDKGEEIRKQFIQRQNGKIFEVLVEKVKGTQWSGWTQNYIELDETNFLIRDGQIKKNSIIMGVLNLF